MLIDQIMISLMGLIDSIMVSSIGEAAISGVSLGDSLSGMLTTIFSALGTGGTVIISQYVGKGDRRNANFAMRQCIFSVASLALLTMAICLIFNGKLLTLMYGETDKTIYNHATAYLPFIAISYPFIAFNSAVFGALRAIGNTKAAMYISVFINILNVGGNAFFIYGCGMGADGAALSTLIVRIIGAVISFSLLYRGTEALSLRGFFPFKINMTIIQSIMKVAVPVAIETVLFVLGGVIYKRFANMLGTNELAAHSIGFTINGFLGIPGNAICSVMVIITGQLIGAGNIEESKYQIKRFIGITTACFIITYTLGFFCTDLFASLYHLSAESTDCLRTIMLILMLSMPIAWPSGFVPAGALRAAGDGKFTMYTAVLSMWIMRVSAGYLLSITLGFGLAGLWLGMVLDWASRSIVFIIRLRGKKWYAKKLI